ncbi:MAG: CDP-alcohol phosphatidyltransferase family protein [Candidatus Marinimicrobia bacterium]|nr:CDP-alcohol phosphatidyltransferase family protein [Candidatus Neomarinimicrobiota bacterium]
MDNNKKAKRVIDTLTGPWERRVLPKMAAALPEWIKPDHLTILGIISGFIIAAGYILTLKSSWWLLLSNLGLLIHWYADSLDGTLARVRHQEREQYGYFVDHICDAFTTAVVTIGIGFSPLMKLEIALFITIGYLLLNIYAHVGSYTEGIFRISFNKIGPTEVRIGIALINFVLIGFNPTIKFGEQLEMTVADLGGILISTIFIIVFCIFSVKDAIRLDRLSRLEKEKDGQL